MWMNANLATKQMIEKRFSIYKTVINIVSIVFFVLLCVLLLVSVILLDFVFIFIILALMAGIHFEKKYVVNFISELESKSVFVNDGLLKSKERVKNDYYHNQRKRKYKFTLEIEEEEFDIIVNSLVYTDYEVGSSVPVICVGDNFSHMEIYDWRNQKIAGQS